jgi:hypothetical protein
MDEPVKVHGSRAEEDGRTSLEVRWIRPGLIPDRMIERLGPFTEELERRDDRYLVDPWLPELSVKVRGDIQLDLKAYRGSPGELDVHGLGRGPMETWEKWAFPLVAGALPSHDASRWVVVRKVRRRRSFAVMDARVEERPLGDAELPGCSVELTEATIDDEAWWTLCIEATGSEADLDRKLLATAVSLVPAEGLPKELQLDARESMSYVRWLGSLRSHLGGSAPAP